MRFTYLNRFWQKIIGLKRLVYRERTDYDEPNLDVKEYYSKHALEAIRQEEMLFEEFHGFHITDDQALEADRLGIRDRLVRRLNVRRGGRNAMQQILDERINFRLQQVVGQEISYEKHERNFHPRRGFFGTLRALWHGRAAVDTANRIEREFGADRTIENMLLHTATLVLRGGQFNGRRHNGLNVGQRTAVSEYLEGLGVPLAADNRPLLVRQAEQLRNATPTQLLDLRRNVEFNGQPVFPPRRIDDRTQHPLYPPTIPVPPQQPIDRLLQLRQIHVEEKKDIRSTTTYDPQRLEHFVDNLRQNNRNIYDLVMHLLKTESLFKLRENPKGLALLAYLEFAMQRPGALPVEGEEQPEGAPPNMERIMAKLQAARDAMTDSETIDEKDKKAKELHGQLEEVKRLTGAVRDTYYKLRQKYAQAPSMGQELFKANQNAAQEIAANRGQKNPVNIAQNRRDKVEERKSALHAEINDLERQFSDDTLELWRIIEHQAQVLNRDPLMPAAQEGVDKYENLRLFEANIVAPMRNGLARSDEQQLFGQMGGNEWVPPSQKENERSPFLHAINQMEPAQIKGVVAEVGNNFHTMFKPKNRYTPHQLLTLLMAQDFERRLIAEGVDIKAAGNEEMTYRLAKMWADEAIWRAGTGVQLERSTSQEQAEYLTKTPLQRWFQRMLGRFTDRAFTAEQVINYFAGANEEYPELSMFHGMRPNITQTEFRDHIERMGGISTKALKAFVVDLSSFYSRALNSTAEIVDSDAVTLKNFIDVVKRCSIEISSREYMDKIAEMPVGAKTKAQLIIEGLEEEDKAEDETEKTWWDKVKEKVSTIFNWRRLKETQRDKLFKAYDYAKEHKLDKREYFAQRGLLTAAGVMSTALAAKEAADVARKVGKVMGKPFRKAASGNRDWGTRGALAAGRGFVRGGLWTGRQLARPVKWSARTAGKIISAPFRLAGWAGRKAGQGAKAYWNWL